MNGILLFSRILTAGLAISITVSSLGQSQWIVDEDFNHPGEGQLFSTQLGLGHVNDMVLQSDNRIVVIGGFTQYKGLPAPRIFRMFENGDRDESFDAGTGFSEMPERIWVDYQDRLYVTGASGYNGQPTNGIIRILPDGTLDETFSIDVSQCKDVLFLPNGNMLIGGNFTMVNDEPRGRIALLDSMGNNIPALFGSVGFNGIVHDMLQLEDGRILIGGAFDVYTGQAVGRGVIRLNPDFSIDDTFIVGSGFSSSGSFPPVQTIATDSQDRILVGGLFNTFSDIPVQGNIVRLLPDGTLDLSFEVGTGFNGYVAQIIVKPNEEIAVIGSFLTFDNHFSQYHACINPDGQLANSHSAVFEFIAMKILIANSGSLFVGGLFHHVGIHKLDGLVKFSPEGTLDFTFNATPGPNDMVVKTCELPGNKYILLGRMSAYGNTPCRGVVVIDSQGEIDPQFQLNFEVKPLTSFHRSLIDTLVVDTNGQIYLVGLFEFDGIPYDATRRLIRIHQDGTLDSSFGEGYGLTLSGKPEKIVPVSGGRLMLCGLQSINGLPSSKVVRLFSDGQIDDSFSTSPELNVHYVDDILELPSGKMILAGRFTSLIENWSHTSMVKINQAGEPELNFPSIDNQNNTSKRIKKLIGFPDGKILAIGHFNDCGGLPFNSMVKFLPNGEIDPAFDNVNGGTIHQINRYTDGVLMPDWSVLLVGRSGNQFTVGLIQTDGSYFDEFPSLSWGILNHVLLEESGVIFSGSFLSINENERPRLVRFLFNQCIANTLLTQNGQELMAVQSGGEYVWYNCTEEGLVPIFGATGYILNIVESGWYALEVVEDKCSDVSPCFYVSALGVANPIHTATSVSLYPNPTADHLTLTFREWESQATSVQIIDSSGRQIRHFISHRQMELFDLTDLPSGIYVLTVLSKNGSTSKRFVKL